MFPVFTRGSFHEGYPRGSLRELLRRKEERVPQQPCRSCLSNLFWLSHVFKTNPVCVCVYVTHSVYRTGTGDKSSFVTNTILLRRGKSEAREEAYPLVCARHPPIRPVCFLLTLVVNVPECERRPPGRQLSPPTAIVRIRGNAASLTRESRVSSLRETVASEFKASADTVGKASVWQR